MATPDDDTDARDGHGTDDDLLAAEREVQARLGDRPLDFGSLDAISNLYRAAAAVRRRAEAGVLAEQNLSFGGFTILWVLWVWGEMETARLAEECGLAKGTLTGMATTLEKRGLLQRHPIATDRRRVLVTLTPDGEALIDDLFPRFNHFETAVTSALSSDEKRELARLLRLVTTTATEA